jgi:hypothetical protein
MAPMGSSGMKRKGRKHLPKVGTRQADEYETHDRQQASLHPFSKDPFRRGGGSPVLAIVLGAVVVFAVFAVLVATL